MSLYVGFIWGYDMINLNTNYGGLFAAKAQRNLKI